MSQKTHTVKLRDGKAPAEQVTDAELATMKKAFGRGFANYEVTPIAPKAEKPAPALQAEPVKTEKAKSDSK